MPLSETSGDAAARPAPDAVVAAFFGVLSRLEAAMARPVRRRRTGAAQPGRTAARRGRAA